MQSPYNARVLEIGPISGQMKLPVKLGGNRTDCTLRMSNLKPPPVYKIIVAQVAMTAILAIVVLVFSNTIAAMSILVGGLVSAIPNCYFAVQAFRYRGARNAEKVVKSFRKGVLGKTALTIVLFALAFSLIVNINAAALITGFVAAQFIGIMMAGLIEYTPSGNT